MIVAIPDLVTAEELAVIREKLAPAEFADGKATAGWHARLVKDNEQLPRGAPAAAELGKLVHEALHRNATYNSAVQPRAVKDILFSRYAVGRSYGTHVDDPVMAGTPRIRSDVSMTLFVSAPEDYGGGELVIQGISGEQTVKLPAGAAVFYPSTTLHRVNEVTEGTRLVAVTWIQSLVRAAEHRQILFDLDQARRSLFQRQGKTAEFDLLSKTHANLMRLWAEI